MTATGSVSAPARRGKPRRWITAEIERLNPETDYAAIWRLTSSYGLNDFALNLVYAHLFPHSYLPPHGSRPLWDDGDGKVVERALQRVEDTIRNNLLWWYYGPSHPKTRQSVQNVNKLHAYHARRHPGDFAHQDDYVFTLAFSAASLHRFNLKIGLPGYTPKQKTAAHLFWQHMADLFTDEHGRAIMNFPPDWDSLIAFVEDFESRSWPATRSGAMVTHAVLDQFACRWFPAPLRGLGRAMAASTLHPNCWATHKVTVPPRAVRRVLLRTTGLIIRSQQLARPDQERTYFEDLASLTREQRAARSSRIRRFDEEFSRAFRVRHGLPPRKARVHDGALPTEASFAKLRPLPEETRHARRALMNPDVATPAGGIDPASFRRVLGRFCTGVTVITSLGPGGPLGLTCQSFSSLSLDPPLILFSPARTSTTWPKMREIGRLCVNILAEEHSQVSIQMSRSAADKFAGVRWEETPLGSPRLAGAVAWLDCALEAEHDGGDHTIVVAAVHSLSADPTARPLLYYQGQYTALPADAQPSRPSVRRG
jgi:flavin reductase (DIM6/NTAB) family NADH-FMN oxidoreductase RutF